MPLLEAMPMIWCTVLAFALLCLVFCGKSAAVIVASIAAFAAAVAGVPPWLQVVFGGGIGLFVRIIFTCWQREKREIGQYALVVSHSENGRGATVLYHGGYHTATAGCRLTAMPPCGSIVQIFTCDNDQCIICPQ